MSFGLGISFGRLCRRERTLKDIYLEARKIEGWEDHENENCRWGRNWITRRMYQIKKGTPLFSDVKVSPEIRA